MWTPALKVASTLLMSLMLFALYRDAVHPAFAYMGFVYHEPDYLLLSLAIIIASALVLFLPDRMELPSDVFIWFFFILVFLPSLIVPLMVTESLPWHIYLGLSLSHAVALLLFALLPKIPLTILPVLSQRPRTFWAIAGAVLLMSFVSIALGYPGGVKRLLTLQAYSDIYNLRFSFREQSQAVFFLSPYFLLWSAKVMVPLFFVLGLHKKSMLIITSSVLAQIFLFSVSGHKSFILSIVLVGMVFWLGRKKNGGIYFLAGMTAFVALSALVFYLADAGQLVNIIVRRAILVPGMLSGFYYEHFTTHGYALYAHNFLNGVFASGYSVAPAFEIGSTYFGREETSSNVHFWADAYANLGFLGVLASSLLVLFVLILLNAAARTRQRHIVTGLVTIPLWTLMESSFNTALFSHGLLLALVLALLAPAAGDTAGETARETVPK